MLIHLRLMLMLYVIWTAALMCVTNGAPVVEINMLKGFLADFAKCRVLDYVALPVYKSDNDESGSNTDQEGNYDLSVPLETCTTTPEKDSTAVPICNEAFELIRNLSTCRGDIEMLNKAIPSSFETISIAAPIENVCEEFSANQNLFARKESYVAYKYADKAICPLVCREKVLKACAFLLWGYKVQAKINDTLQSSVPPNNQGLSVGQSIELGNQNAKHPSDVGNPALVHSGKQSVDNMLAGKLLNHIKTEDDGINKPLITTVIGHMSQSPAGSSKPPQLNSKVSDIEKNNLKVDKVSEKKVGESELSKPISDIVGAVTSPKVGVPTKAQPGDNRSVVKIGVSSTTVTGKSTPGSLSGTSVSDKSQLVRDGHSEEGGSSVKPKISTVASTDDSEPHKITKANVKGNLLSNEMTKETDANNLSNVNVASVGQENKEEGASPSSNVVSKGSSVDKHLHDTSEVSDGGDQEYTGDELSQETSVKNSAKNEDTNEGNPPSDTENKSKPDTSVKDTAEENQNPKDLAHKKTDVATVPEVNSASEDPAPKEILGTLDVGDKSQPVDEVEGDNRQFDVEGSEDSYDGNFDPSVNVNENALPGLSKPELNSEPEVASDSKKLEPHANNDANKTPVKSFDKIASFPQQEDKHFFFYFVTIVIFAIGGYVLFHNKQKIFALIIEGRHERRRRSGASYRKLETK